MHEKIALCMFLVATIPPLHAETLHGTLTDDGVPVPLAEVTLIDAESHVIVKRSHSDIHGRYRMEVTPGRYSLRASKDEYADEVIKDITVGGNDAVVDLVMTPKVFVDSQDVPRSGDCD